MTRHPHPACNLLLAGALLAPLAVGCSSEENPVAVDVVTPSARSTPEGTVQLLETAYESRDPLTYASLFTEDYQFQFAPGDPAGDAFQTEPWAAPEELASALHLFEEGSATLEPASAIVLDFGAPLQSEPEGGALDPTNFRKVTAPIHLEVQVAQSQFSVQGTVTFHLVRASAAQVPPEFDQSVGPDDWLIHGWEDGTLTSVSASPQPAETWSWGRLKATYL
jgi:hypothetical protein